ncbi:MAG: MFS transporter [Erythrobacteraceae bacterium]|jgi:DHA1 family inner membrane transport protein|nr:MFS transporter [Erythrobacteraceae bacterium]
MNLRLLSLVFAPFAFGTSAFVFIGLIEPMALDLAVSIPAIGQLQTVFALACGIGGPILARLAAGFDRKRVLLSVMAILATMNFATSVATSFDTIAAIRFAGGLFAAVTLPLSTTIAVNMVAEEKRPAAIAIVLGGYTLAFLIGMPVGSVLGDMFGWQAAFWFACAICIIALVILALAATPRVEAPEQGKQDFASALRGDNPLLMGITFLGFCATFATVSFIGPVITAATGLTGSSIGGVQVATGVGSILGLALGAWLAKLPPRKGLALLVSTTVITQLLFALVMLYNLGQFALVILLVAMTAGSAALFATSPIIQSSLAKAAGPAATIAFALNGSMLYFGQGLGAALGGWVTAQFGLAWVGVAGAIVAMAALAMIAALRRRGV